MIRLPPTALVLGRSDLRDFEKRRQEPTWIKLNLPAKSAQAEATESQHAGLKIDSRGSLDAHEEANQWRLPAKILFSETVDGQPKGSLEPMRDSHEPERSEDATILITDEYQHVETRPEDEGNDLVSTKNEASPAPANPEVAWPSSLSEHDFQDGGYAEDSNQEVTDFQHALSLFTLEDISTPRNTHESELRRPRDRAPVPQSSLYVSQNYSSSPERPPIGRLTSHIISRIVSQGAPGLTFSQPVRRHTRRLPPKFRHQTNSFSFDSSERSSAVYDQERVASTSTTNTHLSDCLSLHDELRGSSLQSSSTVSLLSLDLPQDRNVYNLSLVAQGILREDEDTEQGLLFLSPQLPLPASFSTNSHDSSSAEVLHSLIPETILVEHRLTSLPGHSSSSPVANSIEIEPQLSPSLGVVVETALSQSSHRIPSPRLFRRGTRHVDICRSRTPSNQNETTIHEFTAPTLTLDQTSIHQSPRNLDLELESHFRHYQVYNDSIASDTQPQTPANLPEARHQSRYHPSHTVPVGRTRVAQRSISSVSRSSRFGSLNFRYRSHNAVPSRIIGRLDSPTGLRYGGFEGLYGGRENGDEEQIWADGVRFDNVGVRLWSSRPVRNDERNLRESPEQEDYRVVTGRGN